MLRLRVLALARRSRVAAVFAGIVFVVFWRRAALRAEERSHCLRGRGLRGAILALAAARRLKVRFVPEFQDLVVARVVRQTVLGLVTRICLSNKPGELAVVRVHGQPCLIADVEHIAVRGRKLPSIVFERVSNLARQGHRARTHPSLLTTRGVLRANTCVMQGCSVTT